MKKKAHKIGAPGRKGKALGRKELKKVSGGMREAVGYWDNRAVGGDGVSPWDVRDRSGR